VTLLISPRGEGLVCEEEASNNQNRNDQAIKLIVLHIVILHTVSLASLNNLAGPTEQQEAR
jgi:hypothetical protein